MLFFICSKEYFKECFVSCLFLVGFVLPNADCFFVKDSSSQCLASRGFFRYHHTWGELWDVLRLPEYNCLASASQFRFDDNGVMYNIEKNGCLAAYKIPPDTNNIFYIYVPTPGQESSACGRKENRAITQTPERFLQIEGNDRDGDPLEKRCVYDIGGYNVLAKCKQKPPLVSFVPLYLGSVTCYGNTVTNVSCPHIQTMVVETAAYRGLGAGKTCGFVEDVSPPQADVGNLVKSLCDGKRSCEFNVNETLFPGEPWPRHSKYLYFEYKCVDAPQPFQGLYVMSVLLSGSTLPNEGYVHVTIRNKMSTICEDSLKDQAKHLVCRHLGYLQADSVVGRNSSGIKIPTFLGTINCNGREKFLFQCKVNNSTEACTSLPYIKCSICSEALLVDKEKFPDSSFTSNPPSDPNAMNARISSGSSWCATASDENQYLQVDLGKLYVINTVATFGDSKADKWVTSYNLNYSVDLKTWNQTSTGNRVIFKGNVGAQNNAAIRSLDENITAQAIRFIPLQFMTEPCMKVQICGHTLLPDKPANLSITNITSRSADLLWIRPVNEGDKPVLNYMVKLTRNNSTYRVVHSSKTIQLLENLAPFTRYDVSVAARNIHGFSEETSVEFNTTEAAPEGPPLNVKAVPQNSSSIFVSWNPPEEAIRNGVIVSYTVCISEKESKVCNHTRTANVQALLVSHLKPLTRYYVRVLASTKAGSGNYSESKAVRTNAEPPMLTNKTQTTLTFQIVMPSQNFTYFQVVAMERSDGDGVDGSSSIENSELVTYDVARANGTPLPYIAAIRYPSDNAEKNTKFVLGDNMTTSYASRRKRRSTTPYRNGPLESGTGYSIFQRVFLAEGGNYSTDWSPVSRTSMAILVTTDGPKGTEENKSDKGSSTGIIAGVAAGAGVFILVIIILIIIKRRQLTGKNEERALTEEEKQQPSTAIVTNEAFENLTALDDETQNEGEKPDEADALEKDEKTNLQDGKDSDMIYANQETITSRTYEPIPVAEFADYVLSLRRETNKLLSQQFDDLPSSAISKWDVAKRSHNISKNRYGNAVTYNHARVILSGDENSDYINASFIDGITEKYYIATQGPKENTVIDFWRMIFEHKCPTIVMLTTLREMGKVKCEKYWPDLSATYGDIKVKTKKSRMFADYMTRVFIVEKDGEQLGVQQFHFMSWPDYGVPLYPTQMLTFRKHFKSYHETKKGPAVIHCSAGVGRTGVFITIDKVLDNLDQEKQDTIDVFGIVKDMRKRRVNMVQTPDQYMFIHEAIVDHVKCGANEVEATHVMSEIKRLSEKSKKGRTGFEEKFKLLNSVSPKLTKEQCDAALLEENCNKNRNPDIYPSESGRVYLSHLEDVENSDYINACYVDGYLGRNYFIATQTPLAKTIGDFWRMVLEHNSSTIVMLNQLREEEEEYPIFWPTQRAKPQTFGKITAVLDSFVKKDNIVLRKFLVSQSPDLRGARMVRMIHYMSWPDHGVPENADDFVKLLAEVEESQRFADTRGPVTVVCSDGAGRTGTYIAISNLVDRVKVVQVIDVFQCIKLIRVKRPQFVETASQFQMCYYAVSSVLKSFKEYSNFSLNDE